MEESWIRLDTQSVLDPAAWDREYGSDVRLAWIGFQCLVKEQCLSRRNRSSMRVWPHIALASVMGLSIEAVTAMIAAAIEHGALIEERGVWTITDANFSGRSNSAPNQQENDQSVSESTKSAELEPIGQKTAEVVKNLPVGIKSDQSVSESAITVKDISHITNNKSQVTDHSKKNQPPANLGGEDFDSLWIEFESSYPKRKGETSMGKAKSELRKLFYASTPIAPIVAGAKRYAAYIEATGKTNTPYVKAAYGFIAEELWKLDHELPSAEPPEEIDYRTFDPGLGKRPKAWFVARDMPLPIYLVPHAVGHVEEVKRFLAKHGDVGRKLLESEGIQIPIEEAS